MELEQKLSHYRISADEYQLICDKLGRPPEGVEWALFSALWSEHCSYKSSKIHLKKFFNKTERVLESFGENAGVIDLGQGERVAFKMESHNHPSYIEPYQGAATGVGGILRDIFTMGARPIALANYLCFGQPGAERMPHLVDGVVRGIGGYGNCVGVPNISGQTEFDSSYDGNILVNAFALGLFRPGEKVFTSKAAGPGNLVVYVGAKTGRDGVHGASMASESFAEDSDSKKPTVQIGDPFFEKLLIESCLEVMEKDLVVAIQDMGAAGITSSSFEMASKGGVGFDIHLDKVPLRDSSITPEEILLSESQERMLLVCEPSKVEDLKQHFKHWDLDAEVIGKVTAEKQVTLHWQGEQICQIDPDLLVENAPMYDRKHNKWQPVNFVESRNEVTSQSQKLNSESSADKLIKSLHDIRGGSRKWIFRQYDQRVGGATARDCSESVGVLRLPDSGRGLGIVLGCRPYLMRTDAKLGGYDSVYYPALQLAAKGFEPLAITDCLNFGNPEKPELMSEFVVAVESMSAACESLRAPVISGNVSLYNETLDKNVTSTPSVGMVGLRKSLSNLPTDSFNENCDVYLLRTEQVLLSGQFVELYGQTAKAYGEINTTEMAKFVKLTEQMAQHTGVQGSRVSGKFGLAYSLARMTLANSVGAQIKSGTWLEQQSLFNENLYDVLFVVNKENSESFAKKWSEVQSNSKLWRIGETGGQYLEIEKELKLDVLQISEAYEDSWRSHFESLA